jgi:hypothetical protein
MGGCLVPVCIPIRDFSSVPAGTERNIQLLLPANLFTFFFFFFFLRGGLSFFFLALVMCWTRIWLSQGLDLVVDLLSAGWN